MCVCSYPETGCWCVCVVILKQGAGVCVCVCVCVVILKQGAGVCVCVW